MPERAPTSQLSSLTQLPFLALISGKSCKFTQEIWDNSRTRYPFTMANISIEAQ